MKLSLLTSCKWCNEEFLSTAGLWDHLVQIHRIMGNINTPSSVKQQDMTVALHVNVYFLDNVYTPSTSSTNLGYNNAYPTIENFDQTIPNADIFNTLSTSSSNPTGYNNVHFDMETLLVEDRKSTLVN